MNTPNLGVVITNPTARKAIYSAYILIGFVLGGIQAWYGDHSPAWLPQYLSVYGYVGLGVGGLAIANTPAKTSLDPGPQVGPQDYAVDTSAIDETTPAPEANVAIAPAATP